MAIPTGDSTMPEGATAGDDLSGLLLLNLTTKGDLDAAELQAVSRAYDKYIFRARRKKPGTSWLTEAFIRETHRTLLGDIWEWAGKYRTSTTNIGIHWPLVPEQVKCLCEDFSFWDSRESSMPVLEVAARLQNRLTRIHPFKNGNGRHARLMSDIFFYSRRHPLPRWPQLQLMSQGEALRQRYIASMRKADEEDYGELMKFMEDCLSGIKESAE